MLGWLSAIKASEPHSIWPEHRSDGFYSPDSFCETVLDQMGRSTMFAAIAKRFWRTLLRFRHCTMVLALLVLAGCGTDVSRAPQNLQSVAEPDSQLEVQDEPEARLSDLSEDHPVEDHLSIDGLPDGGEIRDADDHSHPVGSLMGISGGGGYRSSAQYQIDLLIGAPQPAGWRESEHYQVVVGLPIIGVE